MTKYIKPESPVTIFSFSPAFLLKNTMAGEKEKMGNLLINLNKKLNGLALFKKIPPTHFF